VGPFLVVLLNFSSDRQSLELNRVFLTSSHVFVAMSVGYGLTLLAASMAAHFDSLKKVSIFGAICALDFALFILTVDSQKSLDPDRATIYGFAKVLCWLAAITCVIILWKKGLQHDRLLAIGIPGLFIFISVALTAITLLGNAGREGTDAARLLTRLMPLKNRAGYRHRAGQRRTLDGVSARGNDLSGYGNSALIEGREPGSPRELPAMALGQRSNRSSRPTNARLGTQRLPPGRHRGREGVIDPLTGRDVDPQRHVSCVPGHESGSGECPSDG
jgi:hypothetical protein